MARTVSFKLSSGEVVKFDHGEGGTFEHPIYRREGVGSYDLPFNDGIAIKCLFPDFHHGAGGRVLAFEDLAISDGPVVPYPDTIVWKDDLILIPSPTTHPGSLARSPHVSESNAAHILQGGAVLPIFFNGTGFAAPNDTTRAATLQIMEMATDLERLDEYPRLASFVSLYGDKSTGPSAMGRDRDQAWLMRNWKLRAGGPEQSGWKHLSQPKWGDGFDGGHYHGVMWPFVNWARGGHPQDWYHGLQICINHVCHQRSHDGPRKGMGNYEKGFAFSGDYFDTSWAKQFFPGVLMYYFATNRHPFFEPFVQEWLANLRRWDPKHVYAGAWGARIGANYLRELNLAFSLFRDPAIYAKIVQAVPHFLSLRDPLVKIWRNHSDGRYPASPWMGFQMCDAIYASMSLLKVERDRVDEVLDSMEAYYNIGVFQLFGKPAMRYRIDPPTGAGNVVLGSFAIPSLSALSKERGGTWNQRASEMEDFIGTYAGSNWGQVEAGNPPPASDIGYEYAPQGLGGWPKAHKFPLMCMLYDFGHVPVSTAPAISGLSSATAKAFETESTFGLAPLRHAFDGMAEGVHAKKDFGPTDYDDELLEDNEYGEPNDDKEQATTKQRLALKVDMGPITITQPERPE